jgi:gamma-glutamylcyclotransferase (GGCT)/AIG2-like uncharacterized protein YtfP
MIYFAYGSNMDPLQMRERCKDASLIGPAELPAHRLCFPRWSDKRQHPVASIEPSIGTSVWGVLFELTSSDVEALDRKEGFRGVGRPDNAYRRSEVRLKSGGAEVSAQTYFAEPNPVRPEAGLPSAGYMKQMVDGAMFAKLPEAYVSWLRSLPTTA